jgi:L-rhamnose mutarotase
MRFVQTLKLKDDQKLITAYVEQHSPQHMWREIIDGIKEVGILEMELYICGNELVMIVDAPDNFNWDEAMAKLATLPRQQEWETWNSQFQQCSPTDTSDQKWHMMKRFFHLYGEEEK